MLILLMEILKYSPH